VANYIEPFAGSLAVLLNRPQQHVGYVETVNDMDAYLCNFWRAVRHDPAAVAQYADNPVNETDLEARHIWLVTKGVERLAHLAADPEYFDAQVAGWWVWGLCCWIGSGWCKGEGPWRLGEDGSLTDSQLPHLGDPGRGINRQLPHLGDPGRGINRQLPHLGNPGRGINRQLPHLGNPGRGELLAYIQALSARLRRVRVCCGDWARVVTDGAMAYADDPPGKIGVFLDPPYSFDVGRNETLYNHEMPSTAAIRNWCVQYQDRARIVLCGLGGEYDLAGWLCEPGQSGSGASYGTRRQAEAGELMVNQRRERIWISPLCVPDVQRVLPLTSMGGGVGR
jgi:hypothetical protein